MDEGKQEWWNADAKWYVSIWDSESRVNCLSLALNISAVFDSVMVRGMEFQNGRVPECHFSNVVLSLEAMRS